MSQNNWISDKNHLSVADKIKELLFQPYRLVLVQQHELERLRVHEGRAKYANYVNALYNHYIINNGFKTYLIK